MSDNRRVGKRSGVVATLSPAMRSRTIGACFLAIAALGWTLAAAAHAQGVSDDRQIRAAPGREVRVGIYTNIRSDCTSDPLPAIRLVVGPAHGAVSVRRATLKATNLRQCLGIDAPAFVAFYRAAADYRGTDAFEIEIGLSGGRKQRQHFRVNVSDGPASERGT